MYWLEFFYACGRSCMGGQSFSEAIIFGGNYFRRNVLARNCTSRRSDGCATPTHVCR